jgi:hypothetical protein
MIDNGMKDWQSFKGLHGNFPSSFQLTSLLESTNKNSRIL